MDPASFKFSVFPKDWFSSFLSYFVSIACFDLDVETRYPTQQLTPAPGGERALFYICALLTQT